MTEGKRIKVNLKSLGNLTPTTQNCRNCSAKNSLDSQYCVECGCSFTTGQPSYFIPPAPHFCTTCHSFCWAETAYGGSVTNELIILLLSIFACLLSLYLGAALFLFFVGYCIWRLSSKHKICPHCESRTVIPSDSPLALKLISLK